MHTARLSAKNEMAKRFLPSSVEISGKYVVGRDPDKSDLVLLPDTISRCHCVFDTTEHGLSILDSSRNGTTVDGRPLDGQVRRLRSGHYTIGLCKKAYGALFEFELLVIDSRDGFSNKMQLPTNTVLLDFGQSTEL